KKKATPKFGKTKRTTSPVRNSARRSEDESEVKSRAGIHLGAAAESLPAIMDRYMGTFVEEEKYDKVSWVFEDLDDQKKPLVPRAWRITTVTTNKKTGATTSQTAIGALHHKISKDVLQEIGEAALRAWGQAKVDRKALPSASERKALQEQ